MTLFLACIEKLALQNNLKIVSFGIKSDKSIIKLLNIKREGKYFKIIKNKNFKKILLC